MGGHRPVLLSYTTLDVCSTRSPAAASLAPPHTHTLESCKGALRTTHKGAPPRHTTYYVRTFADTRLRVSGAQRDPLSLSHNQTRKYS